MEQKGIGLFGLVVSPAFLGGLLILGFLRVLYIIVIREEWGGGEEVDGWEGELRVQLTSQTTLKLRLPCLRKSVVMNFGISFLVGELFHP